ncbi:protein arginine kinase [PVC group bacterium (ex Bugula neritina AB1)]|nr:protein arginine kinase [PVC group bacterium (ex Bugula neritina AB1)]
MVTKPWLASSDVSDDIVISSRVRLARNLSGFPFPCRASARQKIQIAKVIREAVNSTLFHSPVEEIFLSQISDFAKIFLLERHVISKEHAMAQEERSFFLSSDESISFMVNEEDHLRMQILMKGRGLKESWTVLDAIDTSLMEKLNFAFTEQYGFLTQCPTNVGTGMRASIMLHLPAIVMIDRHKSIFETIAKMGLMVRGLYGEGSGCIGQMFQISNQLTLGINEENILKRLWQVVDQVLLQEKTVREDLLKNHRRFMEDKFYRALGVLKNARFMSFSESIDLLSTLWLGCSMNLPFDLEKNILFQLFFLTQPGHIQMLEEKSMTSEQRDAKRADLIRQNLVMV